MYYEDKLLIERVKQMPDFKYIPKNYWLLGIRNSEDHPDRFDDVVYLMLGEKSIMNTRITTNPGATILRGGFKKYNSKGAAVLEANRIYYDVWKPGLHLGRTPGLLQRGAKVTVWRDGDMDYLSEEQGVRETGWFGINFHPDQRDLNAPDKVGESIGGWSAGCQVCPDLEDYKFIINTIDEQDSVTYCLLHEFSV